MQEARKSHRYRSTITVKSAALARYTLISLVLLSFALIRFRLREMPLERDEGEYAYAGQLILQGIAPYKLAYNMKLPGTYAAYSLIMAIFGQSSAGIHLGLIFVNAAASILVFILAARLFGGLAGVVASASYALLSTSTSVLGLEAHASHFVVLPALGGILFLLEGLDKKAKWMYFLSGFLLGLAFIMKQPGILFVLFGGVWFLKTEFRKPMDWRAVIARVTVFSSGAVLPYALTCLILWSAGVLPRFWFWTVTYASLYASSNSLSQALPLLGLAAPDMLKTSILLWIMAAAGLSSLLWFPDSRRHAWFVTGFLLFSFFAVCPGFYFRRHYFILMLPAVSLLIGLAVHSATALLRSWASRAREDRSLRFISRATVTIPAFVFLVSCAYSVRQQQELFFQMDPIAACRSLYGANPFPEAPRVAEYLKAHTSEQARIAVLGSEPEIYFYAHRYSATGYIYTYALMEQQKYASIMQREMINQIETAHPEYIVYVAAYVSWLPAPDSDPTILTWARNYLHDHYEVVGIVDIGTPTRYAWDQDARTYHWHPQNNIVQVFRRKTL